MFVQKIIDFLKEIRPPFKGFENSDPWERWAFRVRAYIDAGIFPSLVRKGVSKTVWKLCFSLTRERAVSAKTWSATVIAGLLDHFFLNGLVDALVQDFSKKRRTLKPQWIRRSFYDARLVNSDNAGNREEMARANRSTSRRSTHQSIKCTVHNVTKRLQFTEVSALQKNRT